MKVQTLIHTALVAEAKPIIGYFGLTCKAKQPFNLYVGEDIVLIASGVGKENTQKALAWALTLFEPQKCINVGIAGCCDKRIAKGTLFCTSHHDIDIPFASLSSHEKVIENTLHVNTLLVDMEAETFLHSIPKNTEAYIFKVVSDHLENTIPTKAEVNAWVQKSLKRWSVYVK